MLLFIGCIPSGKELKYKTMKFIVEDKIERPDGRYSSVFYLKNRDTIIEVERKDYLFFDKGDTLMVSSVKDSMYPKLKRLKK